MNLAWTRRVVSRPIVFAPLPARGRTFTASYKVRLADAGADGRLRLDGVAGFLQDVATDDWEDTGLARRSTWVARRTSIRLAAQGRWPELGEHVEVTTWCGGIGPAWAERRTDLAVAGSTMVEATSLWVPLDPRGRPTRVPPTFLAVFGEASGGRRVSGRVPRSSPPPSATRRPWPIRVADLDVVGHVNNAAVWAAVVERLDGGVQSATVVHHGPLDLEEAVTLAAEGNDLWLLVDDVVRVSARFSNVPTE